MASNPTQELQDEFLSTIRKSQETVIDAIRYLGRDRPVRRPQDAFGPGAVRRSAAQARGGRGQCLRLCRAAAGQPAQVRRRDPEDHDPAAPGRRQRAEGRSRQ